MLLVKKIKPNFKKLGQVFGPKMKLVAAAVQQITHQLQAGGVVFDKKDALGHVNLPSGT